MLSPLNSSLLGTAALVGVPTAIALLAFHRRHAPSVVVGAGLLVVLFAGAFGTPTSMWYVERGWALLLAGGFVVATSLLPDRSLIVRSTTAAVVAGAAVAVTGLLRPELLGDLDSRIGGQFDRALLWLDFSGPAGASLEAALRAMADIARRIYPALLGLASLAALGVTAYVSKRMEGIEDAIGPLRRFRFNDHLAWLLVVGLMLLILPFGSWTARAGGNVVTFMGGLYVLRGAAVLVWVGTAVVSSGWSIALWIVAALLFYPVTLGAALVMGLSDTWLDLRSRLGVEAEND